MQKAIKAFVLSEIADSNDFILEGYHVESLLVSKLIRKYPRKIKALFLMRTHESQCLFGIQKSTAPNDWILARKNTRGAYSKIAKMICEYGKFFQKECEK